MVLQRDGEAGCRAQGAGVERTSLKGCLTHPVYTMDLLECSRVSAHIVVDGSIEIFPISEF